MSPLRITILLHYYFSIDDYSGPSLGSPAYVEAIEYFLFHKLLKDNIGETNYVITERGRAYVKMLTDMPLPVCKWVAPEKA